MRSTNVVRALALCFFGAAITHAQQCYDVFHVFPGRLEGKEPTKYDMFEDINFQVADISECDSLLELTGGKFGDIGVLAIAAAIESDENGHCPKTLLVPSCDVSGCTFLYILTLTCHLPLL